MKLNGWQRLWVVCAGLGGLVIGGITWGALPRTPSDGDMIAPAERAVGQIYQIETDSGVDPEVLIDWWGYGDPTDDDAAKTLDGRSPSGRRLKPGSKTRRTVVGSHLILPSSVTDAKADEILARYNSQVVANLATTRRTHMLLGLVVWLTLAGALYGTGWVVGWVRRGFTRE